MSSRNNLAQWIGLSSQFLALIVSTKAYAQADPPSSLDLPHAIAIARARSPLLRAARLRIDEAHGDLTGASILLATNPEVDVTAGPRSPGRSGERRTPDLDVGLAQRFETGGQRSRRIQLANEELSASRAEAADSERVVTLAVAIAFFDVLAASERTQLTEENQRLAQDLLELARTRIAKGAEPPIVLNSARIRLAESRRKALDAKAEVAATTVRLARVLGMPPGVSLTLAGKLPAAGDSLSDDLIERGLANRPDVLALSRRVGAAQASVRLADAAAWPELRLGIRYGLDQEDRLVLGTVGIAVPVFARNQGERERNRAAALRVETELSGLRLDVEGEIREAKARFDAAAAALALYDAEVLRAQEENLVLIRTTYEAGKTDFTQMVLLERELLEGRLGFLDARLALANAEATLRAAAGLDVAETGRFQGGKQ